MNHRYFIKSGVLYFKRPHIRYNPLKSVLCENETNVGCIDGTRPKQPIHQSLTLYREMKIVASLPRYPLFFTAECSILSHQLCFVFLGTEELESPISTSPICLESQPRPPTSGVLSIHSGNASSKPTTTAWIAAGEGFTREATLTMGTVKWLG